MLRPMEGLAGLSCEAVVGSAVAPAVGVAEEDRWGGEDITAVGEEERTWVAAGLGRRGEVRRMGECGAGCVCTPGREMSKERSDALAEVVWVRVDVVKLCSSWRGWKDSGGSKSVCWVSTCAIGLLS